LTEGRLEDPHMVCASKAVFAAALFGAALAMGFALTASAQTGSEAATPEPAPSATVLPEIGRTRSRPLCTALRDVVAPAILSTQRADAQFSDARALVFKLIAGDPGARGMTLRKVERALSVMARETSALKALLDDPRLAVSQQSVQTADEKARADLHVALQALYESESRQLNALNGYVETGRRTELQADDEDAIVMKGALQGIISSRGSTVVGHESYLGAPPHYTNKLAEANEVDRWFGRVISVTTRRGDAAGNVIVDVATFCRASR
jgi:hypothetical protein